MTAPTFRRPSPKVVVHQPNGLNSEGEISDVFIYLLGLADVLGIDLLQAAEAKLAASRARFPVAEVDGVAPLKR